MGRSDRCTLKERMGLILKVDSLSYHIFSIGCFPNYIKYHVLKVYSDSRGEQGMLDWLEWSNHIGFLKRGDLCTNIINFWSTVITDAENSFSTVVVQATMLEMGVELEHFPAGLGHLMDPCDCYYHSHLKSRYYRLLSEDPDENSERKLLLIYQAYYEMPDDLPFRFMLHTGILGVEEPVSVVERLLSEGQHCSGVWKSRHDDCLKTYKNLRK